MSERQPSQTSTTETIDPLKDQKMEIWNDAELSAAEKIHQIDELHNSVSSLEDQKMAIWNDEELSSAEKIYQIGELGNVPTINETQAKDEPHTDPIASDEGNQLPMIDTDGKVIDEVAAASTEPNEPAVGEQLPMIDTDGNVIEELATSPDHIDDKEKLDFPYEIGDVLAVRRHAYKDGQVDRTQQGKIEAGWKIDEFLPDGSVRMILEHGAMHDGRVGRLSKVVTRENLIVWQDEASTELPDAPDSNESTPASPESDSATPEWAMSDSEVGSGLNGFLDRVKSAQASVERTPEQEVVHEAENITREAARALEAKKTAVARKTVRQKMKDGIRSLFNKGKESLSGRKVNAARIGAVLRSISVKKLKDGITRHLAYDSSIEQVKATNRYEAAIAADALNNKRANEKVDA